MYAAREERRVRAICAQSVVADGAKWRREHEWVTFKHRVDGNRMRRVVDNADELVDPRTELMVAAPEREASGLRQADDLRVGSDFHLATADSILRFRPIEIVDRIGCALLMTAVEDDVVTPIDHALELYSRAMPPKKLVRQTGVTHYEAAIENSSALLELTLDWFGRYVRSDTWRESEPEQCILILDTKRK
jgi:pimeloyl-ACP methyl ester carboxylesterase